MHVKFLGNKRWKNKWIYKYKQENSSMLLLYYALEFGMVYCGLLILGSGPKPWMV